MPSRIVTGRRVVVTGLGAITPLGLTVRESWGNALEGKSGISKITRFDASQFSVQIAGEVKGFNPDLFVPKKEQKKMDLFALYAMAASEEAVKDSGLEWTDELKIRTGVFIGAGMGGLPTIEENHQICMERGFDRLTPFFIPLAIANMAAGHVSMKYGFRGPNFSVTSACATGCHSIGEAMNHIRYGRSDIMIAGGSESTVCGMGVGGFAAMRALSTRNDAPEKASRPWDKDRDGFVLAEGAAVLVLEEYEHAKKRGATIYAEILGYGISSDAHHMTNPAPQGAGAQLCMQVALEDARLSADKIEYINAHGTSTSVGDVAETEAVKGVFGSAAKKIAISSTKSMTGHTLGAAGAIESVFSILALKNNKVPPTINLDNPSPECDLDYVPKAARDLKLNVVLNNSFGFGGTNASLIFGKV